EINTSTATTKAPVPKSERTPTMSYDAIKGVSIEDLPPGVDPKHREKALPNNEFLEVFGMDRTAFYKLPGWKKTSLKKAKGLF
ncbi:MAG: hypothetical protein AAF242_01875, partial [Bacteroidota bacterium]